MSDTYNKLFSLLKRIIKETPNLEERINKPIEDVGYAIDYHINKLPNRYLISVFEGEVLMHDAIADLIAHIEIDTGKVFDRDTYYVKILDGLRRRKNELILAAVNSYDETSESVEDDSWQSVVDNHGLPLLSTLRQDQIAHRAKRLSEEYGVEYSTVYDRLYTRYTQAISEFGDNSVDKPKST